MAFFTVFQGRINPKYTSEFEIVSHEAQASILENIHTKIIKA